MSWLSTPVVESTYLDAAEYSNNLLIIRECLKSFKEHQEQPTKTQTLDVFFESWIKAIDENTLIVSLGEKYDSNAVVKIRKIDLHGIAKDDEITDEQRIQSVYHAHGYFIEELYKCYNGKDCLK